MTLSFPLDWMNGVNVEVGFPPFPALGAFDLGTFFLEFLGVFFRMGFRKSVSSVDAPDMM